MPRKAIKNNTSRKELAKTSVRESKPKSMTRKPTGAKTKVVEENELNITSENKKSPFRLSKTQSIILVGALLVIGLLYQFKSVFIAATVNGQPVSRIEIIREMEKQSGKTTLNSIITKMLILQEAKKQNVSLSDQEVDAEQKRIEDALSKQGKKLDDLLAVQGTTRQELRDQIRMQKLVEKMIGKDIKVTDQEVNKYIEQNKDSFPEGTSQEEIKKSVKQQLEQQKLSDKFQKWLSDLQKKAKINYFVNY